MKCTRCGGSLGFAQVRCVVCGAAVSRMRRYLVVGLCVAAGFALGMTVLRVWQLLLGVADTARLGRVGALLLILGGLLLWRRRQRAHALDDYAAVEAMERR